jgi:uncharacterized protein YjiS (DUF1127 family)
MLQRLNERGEPFWHQPEPQRRRPHSLGSRFADARSRIVETIAVWCDRSKKRRQLARFTPAEMRDLAISRLDVLHEINKPFWRP